MWKISQDTAMGVAIVLTALMLLFRERWFLAETTKGQRLVQRFGADTALWVFRGCLFAVALLGGLLAVGIVKPIRWGRTALDGRLSRGFNQVVQDLRLQPN
jgi:hypothetical protein